MVPPRRDACFQVVPKKIESAFRIRRSRVDFRSFCNGGVVAIFLVNSVRSERRFDVLSSIGTFKEPSYPSPVVLTVRPPHPSSLQRWRSGPPRRPRTEMQHVLDSRSTPNTWQSLWSFADVVTGTPVPRGRRGDESAGIDRFPAPVLRTKYGLWICESRPSLIIEHTNFTEPTYHFGMSTSLFTIFGVICPQFRDCFHD